MRSLSDDARKRAEAVDPALLLKMRIVRSSVSFLAIAIIAGAPADTQLLLERPSCQFNIVSSTVVAVYCSHRAGDAEVLDLFIAWRGLPGWFQSGKGTTGAGGQSGLGTRGLKGRVSQYAIYNGVTAAFDADFDARTVAIDGVVVSLESLNTILIDHVEQTNGRQPSATLQIEPRLPLGQDVNLVLARRSRELREFLQCDVPMPIAASRRQQPPVITVCEKLAARRP